MAAAYRRHPVGNSREAEPRAEIINGVPVRQSLTALCDGRAAIALVPNARKVTAGTNENDQRKP